MTVKVQQQGWPPRTVRRCLFSAAVPVVVPGNARARTRARVEGARGRAEQESQGDQTEATEYKDRESCCPLPPQNTKYLVWRG